MRVARFVHVHQKIVHRQCTIRACASKNCASTMHDSRMCINKLCIDHARFVHVHVYRDNSMHKLCIQICTPFGDLYQRTIAPSISCYSAHDCVTSLYNRAYYADCQLKSSFNMHKIWFVREIVDVMNRVTEIDECIPLIRSTISCMILHIRALFLDQSAVYARYMHEF